VQSADTEPSCEQSPAGRIADDNFWIMPIGGCEVINTEHSLTMSELLSDGVLSDLHTGSLERVPHVEFLVAIPSPARLVYNSVYVGSLWTRLETAKGQEDLGLILLDRSGRPTLQFWPRDTGSKVRNQLMATIAARDLQDTTVITSSGFGQSLMTEFNNSLLVRAISLDAPAAGWRLAVVLSPRAGILAGRQAQLIALTVMLALASFATLVATLVTRYGEVMVSDLYGALSRIAKPVSGSRIHRLLAVEEIDAIQSELDRTGAIFRQDRELMGLYERRMRQVEAHAPVIVYSLAISHGEKGSLDYVSAAAERILGFEMEEIAKPGWWSHNIHPDDYASVRKRFSGLQADSTVTAEYRLRRKDGTYRWVYDTLSTAEDGQAVGVLFDVTRRKAAELQLIQTAKLASLGEMATGMAHELNQPLNVIKMAASNLLRRARSGSAKAEDLIERLQRILEQTNRASSLIGHMRVFGRKPEEASSVFLARDAIDGALALIGRQMALARIELIVEERTEDLKVKGYQTLLEQVVLNLVLNARDAIVEVAETDETRDRLIRLTLDRTDDHVVLQVEDSGGGISEAALDRVFEPFFTTKPVQSGTGLGLSVSYGIIRDMKGTIEAVNAEHGACFTIRLPVSAA
jgi:PAS domain S-box-containing protein